MSSGPTQRSKKMAVQDLPELLAALFVAGEATGLGVAKFIAACGEVGRGIGHGSVVFEVEVRHDGVPL